MKTYETITLSITSIAFLFIVIVAYRVHKRPTFKHIINEIRLVFADILLNHAFDMMPKNSEEKIVFSQFILSYRFKSEELRKEIKEQKVIDNIVLMNADKISQN